jgi:hypothetical protein
MNELCESGAKAGEDQGDAGLKAICACGSVECREKGGHVQVCVVWNLSFASKGLSHATTNLLPTSIDSSVMS